MNIDTILERVNAGEVVIVDTSLRTISDRQKGDNFDAFYDWFESQENIVDKNGKPWLNRNTIPATLISGNLVVENDEAQGGVLFIYDASRKT